MARDEHTDDNEADLEDHVAEEPDDDEADVEGFMLPTIKPAGILDGLALPAVQSPTTQTQQPGVRRDGVQTQSNEPLLTDRR